MMFKQLLDRQRTSFIAAVVPQDLLHGWALVRRAFEPLNTYVLSGMNTDVAKAGSQHKARLQLAGYFINLYVTCILVGVQGDGGSIPDMEAAVAAEVVKARRKHAPCADLLHGWAILVEEIRELADVAMDSALYEQQESRFRDELVQVAAMAQRVCEDCDIVDVVAVPGVDV